MSNDLPLSDSQSSGVVGNPSDSASSDVNITGQSLTPSLNNDNSSAVVSSGFVPLDDTSDNLSSKTILQGTAGFTGGGKEGERVDMGFAEQRVELEELGKEMEISRELELLGVERRPTEFPVPKEISGIVEPLTGPETPVRQEPKLVDVPLDDDQISAGVKQKITTSIRWLAEYCLKQIKKAHIKIKFVGGRLTRVISN